MLIAGTYRRRTACFMAGACILVGVGISDVTKSFVKDRVKRSRPHKLLDEGDYQFELGGSDEKKEQSFPSGHVAGTVAAAAAISRFYPSAAPYTSSAAGIITLSRVVKGKHWPLDLAAGLAIGWVSGFATRTITDMLFRPFLSPYQRQKYLGE